MRLGDLPERVAGLDDVRRGHLILDERGLRHHRLDDDRNRKNPARLDEGGSGEPVAVVHDRSEVGVDDLLGYRRHVAAAGNALGDGPHRVATTHFHLRPAGRTGGVHHHHRRPDRRRRSRDSARPGIADDHRRTVDVGEPLANHGGRRLRGPGTGQGR